MLPIHRLLRWFIARRNRPEVCEHCDKTLASKRDLCTLECQQAFMDSRAW